MLKKYGQPVVYFLISPFITLLIKCKVTPNQITTVGFFINIGAAVIFIYGAEHGLRSDLSFVGWGGATILFAGLFDMIDGRLAREGQMVSKFGALYDSVLDRWSEIVMFLGIAYYLISHDYFYSSLFAILALIGSVMVSYTRARAEGLGLKCDIGFMQRPERVIIVGTAALLCGIIAHYVEGDFQLFASDTDTAIYESIIILTGPIAIVAAFATYTAIDRLMYCKKQLAEQENQ